MQSVLILFAIFMAAEPFFPHLVADLLAGSQPQAVNILIIVTLAMVLVRSLLKCKAFRGIIKEVNVLEASI